VGWGHPGIDGGYLIDCAPGNVNAAGKNLDGKGKLDQIPLSTRNIGQSPQHLEIDNRAFFFDNADSGQNWLLSGRLVLARFCHGLLAVSF